MHAAGWALLWALYFLLDLPRADGGAISMLLVRAAVWAAGGLFVSLGLERVYALVRVDERTGLSWLAIAALGSLVGAAVWLVGFNFLDWALGIEPGFVSLLEWELGQLLPEYMSYVFPLLAWQGVTRSVGHAARAQQAQARTLRAEREAAEAKLGALRHQLNPHFLFNALNSAVELTRIEPEAAEQTLIDLSVLLRETLRAPTGTHRLERELILVQRYVDIERRRFGERLEASVNSEARSEFQVPVLALLALVENAVKHGMRGRVAPLRMSLAAREEAGKLIVVVENDGQLEAPDADRDSGVGLANLRERLRVTHPGCHQFDLCELAGPGGPRVRATLTLGEVSK
jgi:hypothetical protein